jgi:hypothetical protein
MSAEMKQNDIERGEMNAKLSAKIEEPTLYVPEQQKQIDRASQYDLPIKELFKCAILSF